MAQYNDMQCRHITCAMCGYLARLIDLIARHVGRHNKMNNDSQPDGSGFIAWQVCLLKWASSCRENRQCQHASSLSWCSPTVSCLASFRNIIGAKGLNWTETRPTETPVHFACLYVFLICLFVWRAGWLLRNRLTSNKFTVIYLWLRYKNY